MRVLVEEHISEYLKKCFEIREFADEKNLSERELSLICNLPKSNIHRMLQITKLPSRVLDHAIKKNTQRWILYKLTTCIDDKELFNNVVKEWMETNITQHKQLCSIIKVYKVERFIQAVTNVERKASLLHIHGSEK